MTTHDLDENNDVYDADKCEIDFDMVIKDDPSVSENRKTKPNPVSARRRIEHLLDLRRIREELDDPFFDLD